MGRFFQRVVVVWALLALVAWGLLFLVKQEIFLPQIGYYVALFVLAGVPLWLRREQIGRALRAWGVPPLPRYLVLGYGMVLFEEILAASFNHVLEGFDLAGLPLRIGQFWALNVLAFTGWIWGWYLLRKWFTYTPREAFFLSGIWGLFAEHTVQFGPVIFLLIAPLNILTYGLILSPAMLSLPPRPARRAPVVVRYPLTFVIPLLASLAPILLLTVLRAHFPGWFPPCSMVQCDAAA